MSIFVPRQYQSSAVEWLSRRKRGMVVAPAGSGKTLVAAAALARVIGMRKRPTPPRIGWLANTVEQCLQAAQALAAFPETAQLLNDGFVTIACAAAGTDWSGCDVLIVDENHHSISNSWFKQIETCQGALWGFTATPDTGDEARDAALAQLFSERFVVDRIDVAHNLSKATVIFHDDTDAGLKEAIDAKVENDLPYRLKFFRADEVRRVRAVAYNRESTEEQKREAFALIKQVEQQCWGQVAWQACVELGIVGNAARSAKALRLAAASQVPTLVLVNQVEHAQWFEAQLPAAVACFAKMGKKKRAAALQGFRDGTVRRLVATSLADEGLDLPMAACLVLVSAGKSNAKTEQRTGRVLRLFAGKDGATIHDFADPQHPLMAKHARARCDLYRRLGYEVTGRVP